MMSAAVLMEPVARRNDSARATLRIEIHNDIDALDPVAWNALVSRGAVGLEMAHLLVVERARVNDAENYYLIAFHEDRPIGIAHFFVIDLDLASLSAGPDSETIRTLRRYDATFIIRTVECGFVAGLGEAIAARPEYWPQFLDRLVSALEGVARSRQADVVLACDIPVPRIDAYEHFRARGFETFPGFPQALIPIVWNSFDEYVATLKSEGRRTALRARMSLQRPGCAGRSGDRLRRTRGRDAGTLAADKQPGHKLPARKIE